MLKVLIVEDDLMIADALEENLVAGGYAVCGIACTVADAIELAAQHNPDLAIIDFRLRDGQHGPAAAAALRQRSKIGVLYSAANHNPPLLSQAEGEGCFSKPYTASAVISALGIVYEMARGRPAPSTFPRGFQLLNAKS
jgi:CheY-like chemotaxis protein